MKYRVVITVLLLLCIFIPAHAAKINMLIDWRANTNSNRMDFTIRQAYSLDQDRYSCSILVPCYIGMTYSHDIGYPWKYKLSTYGRPTIDELIVNFSKYLPVSGSMPLYNQADACYMVAILFGSSGQAVYLGSTCDGAINPPEPPEPPEPPVSCYLNGNIYLQHGALADSDVAGNRAETVAYVICTRAAKVKVRALSSVGSDSYLVNLRADGSLKSMLAVNGFAGNGGVTLDVSGTSAQPVTFSSLLISSGTPAPGDFSGSAVAVVDII
ncbi:hypothetical protein QTO19_18220 [Serratia marcescens]|uniref:MrpH family fimbial adhesin n=1 Tax=Serratia TaxID=613 RepID=UPI000B708A34|nr:MULTISPECIES: hypothetical protein [Serratia]MBH2986099.1 hypothetical protein [Serratia marcescens]MBH3071705.1 hypothetical protein [Serratia marcescens]MDQ7770564.1 hypothetical protein [Serratia nevei]OUI69999.1 hypothetical protein AZZ99_004315 [Serratia marcescens]HEJ0329695.1 hypothetical protein [Serratia marcescens]